MSELSESTPPAPLPDAGSTSRDLDFARALTRVLKATRDSGAIENFLNAAPPTGTSLKHRDPPALIDSLFDAFEGASLYFRKVLTQSDNCIGSKPSLLKQDGGLPRYDAQDLVKLIDEAYPAIRETLSASERAVMPATRKLGGLNFAHGTPGDDRLVIGAHEYDPHAPNLLAGLSGADSLFGTSTTDIFAHVVGSGDGTEKRIHGFQSDRDKIVALNNFQLRGPETVSSQDFSGRPGSWKYERLDDGDRAPSQWLVSYDTDGDRAADFLLRLEADTLSDQAFLLRTPEDGTDSPSRVITFTGAGERFDSPLPTPLQYDFLDGARKAIRTDLARYLDGKGTAVNEHENYVVILGPRSANPDDQFSSAVLSDEAAEKQRIFVLADETQFVAAHSSSREIFTVAAGGSSPDAEMVISGFTNGQDKIAFVDFDGLKQPQTIVEGASFTGRGAEWRLISAPRQPGRWYANYDRDGDKETDYTLIVEPVSGTLSEQDFLLAVNPSPDPVESDYIPPTLDERLRHDMAETVRAIEEHYHAHGVIKRELDETVLVLGNAKNNVLTLPDHLARPGKPTVFLALDKLDEVICSDTQDVIAHMDGFPSSEFDIILGFEPGVDKFAFLTSGRPSDPPQTVHAGSTFTKANEWIYERFDEDSRELATTQTHPHYQDKIKSLDEKTWLVKYDADGDRKPDLMYLVTDTAALTDNDFLLNL